jgi:hypothetical protein
MPHASLPAPEHLELTRLVSRSLHLLREHLDDVASIPGDAEDWNSALLFRVHEDLLRMQHLLERLQPPRASARACP